MEILIGFVFLIFIGWGVCVIQYNNLDKKYKELLKENRTLNEYADCVERDFEDLRKEYGIVWDKLAELKKVSITDFVIWRGK